MPDTDSTREPDCALSTAERQRIMRLANWCQTGLAAAAELELHEWTRMPGCPDAARVMLAALFAQRGENAHAKSLLEPLHDRPTAELDADMARVLIALLMRCDLSDAAQRLARRLHDAHGDEPEINQWLRVMCVPGQEALPTHSDATVEQLAVELTEQPGVIPTLVYAQKLQPRASSITLLRQAVARCLRHLDAQPHIVSACTALAELALLIGDDDDARRWAHRGLKLDPYNAALALMVSKVSDDPYVGEPAVAVLDRVAKKHPSYPDVRAALIRRQFAEGDGDHARMRLSQWLENEPTSPIARTLQKEMAA